MREEQTEIISVAQIQELVHVLDRSDISEVEWNRAGEGRRLVLRKLKVPGSSVQVGEVQHLTSSNTGALTQESATVSGLHHVTADMVGTFHPWLKPRGGTLATVGDLVKVGQIVGTIEALNVLNEVEATVAGRVVEVHIKDGQPVEYGQLIITINSSGIEKV